MSLRLKILCGFIFVMAIFTIAGGVVSYNIGKMQEKVNLIPYEVERNTQLNIINYNVAAQTAAIRGFLYSKQDNYAEQFRKLGEENKSIIQNMIDTAMREDNKEKYIKLMEYQDNYNTLTLGEIIPLIKEGKEKEANEIIINQGVPLSNSFNKASIAYAEERNNSLLEIVRKANLGITSMQRISRISIALALLVGLLLALFLARAITLPIQRVATESIKIAEGDLTGEQIDIKTKDEVGQLAMAFNKMLHNLRELVMEVQEKSQLVSSSSMQLSASSQNVAAGAQETAATVTEVASTVEQVTLNTQKIAVNADHATNYAHQGTEGLSQISKQMKLIEKSTTGSGEDINMLNQSAAQISQIVELITQIADQTNLLALNAAIEAARAGEQGRGFAVVAEEVRKLAEQSANAAKEIHQLITSIQQEINKAVQSMADSVGQVKKGSTVVLDVGTTFANIIAAVQNLSEEIQSVASAAEQMSAGVQNVAANTEEQTTTVEEVSTTSQNLARMAEELESFTKRFKI